jgi:hypothetical protein
MAVDDTRYAETMAWIERVVAHSPLLQSTTYEFYTDRGQLWVKVKGANYEAHAWHVAVGGHQLPSYFDAHGVRHSTILGIRVHVEVIDDPKTRDAL